MILVLKLQQVVAQMVRPERIVLSGFLFVTFFIACEATGVRFSADTSSLQIDEQLYSRQIFVYGKSAQQSLISSHVLVKGSNQALAAEIVKNLALAGVGKLTIVNESKKSKKTITKVHMNSLCGSESLAEFARSLNPSISVIFYAQLLRTVMRFKELMVASH